MFRIHDILVRIRILGSLSLTNGFVCGPGSGCGSGFGSGCCSFRQWPSRCQKIKNFYVFMLLFESTFSSFFQDKVIKNVMKLQNRRNQGFSSFSCLLMDGSGSGCGSRRSKTYGSYGSYDPDPDADQEHWQKQQVNFFISFNQWLRKAVLCLKI